MQNSTSVAPYMSSNLREYNRIYKKYDSTIDFAYHSCNNRSKCTEGIPSGFVGSLFKSGRAVSRNLCNITLFDWIE